MVSKSTLTRAFIEVNGSKISKKDKAFLFKEIAKYMKALGKLVKEMATEFTRTYITILKDSGLKINKMDLDGTAGKTQNTKDFMSNQRKTDLENTFCLTVLSISANSKIIRFRARGC